MLITIIRKAQSDPKFRNRLIRLLDAMNSKDSMRDILKRWGNGSLFRS